MLLFLGWLLFNVKNELVYLFQKKTQTVLPTQIDCVGSPPSLYHERAASWSPTVRGLLVVAYSSRLQ